MPASIASSHWDFTPVINLLRSPTYGSGDLSVPRHTEDHATPSPSAEELTDTTDGSNHYTYNSTNNEGCTIPSLGDFSSLWDILGQDTATASAKATPVEDRQDADATPRPRSPQSPTPVKILKRPSSNQTNSENLTKDPPRTPPRSIPGSGSTTKSRSNKGQADVGSGQPDHHNKPFKAAHEAVLSDSTAEAESDASVFDPPLSQKRDTVSSKPSQVGASSAKPEIYDSPPSSFDELDGSLTPETLKKSPNNGVIRVQSKAYKSARERKVGLLTKLLERFPDYTETVSQVGRSVNSSSGNSSSRPIHVFVDISNIMVGFHDSVKLSRDIPIKTRIRRLPLSFQNFSLILERGRPTAKRILVGSDRFAAIDEGEKLGYETNILDRVHKIKQMTRRQAKFNKKTPRIASQEAVNSSEMNEAAGERWVEQGVDEILHLKILESLLDTDKPATIVLATGDAAEAEYSGGFMKMVERALQRGWTVELVSFSQVTSQAYRRKEFRAKWGDQFKMIALDEYLEELFAI